LNDCRSATVSELAAPFDMQLPSFEQDVIASKQVV
jgi:hypothetical protein